LDIDPVRIWFIHNGEKLSEHKNELGTKINVHVSRSMVASNRIAAFHIHYKQKKDNGNFFLCHNRSPRIHRYGILCLLKKYGILDDNVNWSLICGYAFNNQKPLFKQIFNIDDILDLTKEIEYFLSIDIKKSKYEINYAGLDDRERQNLPFDAVTLENSYVNIVTESNYDFDAVHITEKSLKPFYFYQLPIFLSSPRHLKYLRELHGFDLFDDFINHSYDREPNIRKRFFMVLDEIKRLNKNKDMGG
jgi:hypothetical protein